MDFETMQKIVDNAPEWADTYLFHGIYSDSKIVDCGAMGISSNNCCAFTTTITNQTYFGKQNAGSAENTRPINGLF